MAKGSVVIRTPYKGGYSIPEKNGKPSLTVPDQTLTIKQLLKRHTAGSLLFGFKPEFEDEVAEVFPDIRKLDLSEVEDIRRQYYEERARLKNVLYDARKKRLEDLDKARMESLIAEKLKMKQDEAKPA